MGIFKCNVAYVWSLVLVVLLVVIPRSWEARFESLITSYQPPFEIIPNTEVAEGRIERNATLVATFMDYDIPVTVANEVAQMIMPVFDVRAIRFGHPYRLEKEIDGTLRRFEYRIDDERILRVEKAPDSYEAKVESIEFEIREEVIVGEIQSSLWDALGQYPKREWLTNELANKIFAWDVDFSSDIQRGDRIRLIVDEQYHQGSFVKYGRIHAAELENKGRVYRAFLFRDAYYDENGNALERSLLASPLLFDARISSGFTRRRVHPILNQVRAHLAIDYAAPTGTPVVAVASGTVTFAGWNGGYGNLVQVRHQNGLGTGYAHLSRIAPGIRAGRQVRQGERIGSVGATGLATGPHLHYMMTRNGNAINPLELHRLQPPVPLEASLRPEYFGHIAARQLALQIIGAEGITSVAQLEE